LSNQCTTETVVLRARKKRGVTGATPLVYGQRPSSGRLRGSRSRFHRSRENRCPGSWPVCDNPLPASGRDRSSGTWGCRRGILATRARSDRSWGSRISDSVLLSSTTHGSDFGLFPDDFPFVGFAVASFPPGLSVAPLVLLVSGLSPPPLASSFLPLAFSWSALAACL
jgi:hypothetical protein